MKNMGIRVPRLVLLQLTYLALVERSNVATIVRNMVVDVAYERCPTSIRNDPEALLAAIRELKVQQVDEELEELSDSPDEAAALVLEEQNE